MNKSSKAPYYTAWVLFLGMIALAVFGSSLKPHPITPEHKIAYEKRIVAGQEEYVMPPLKPDSRFWFGTDHRGYDILSLLLNGMKYTLGFALAVTLARFLIALPIGLAAGVSEKGKGTIATLQIIFTSVPAILFIFPPLAGLSSALHITMGLPPDHPNMTWFFAFCFGLATFIGIFSIAKQMSDRAYFFAGKAYVTAARTMGASRGRIIRKHVLPHMQAEILFAFLAEYVQVLVLMGQLAVLGIFIFGGEVYSFDPVPYEILLTTTGEWCAMISYGAAKIRLYPWIALSTGAVYAASILVVQFFLSQLKLHNHGTAVRSGKTGWSAWVEKLQGRSRSSNHTEAT